MHTNVVVGETVDGQHHCVYIGPSVDDALAAYAKLRAKGGEWSMDLPFIGGVKFKRALCSIDPRTSKHCSFAA